MVARRFGFDSAGAMTNYFRDEGFDTWPTNPHGSKALADALLRLNPKIVDDAASRADLVLRHQFSLLGSGRVDLGPSIDWLCDFKTGRRWPPQYYRRIDYVNYGEPSDVKVPWELSRAHHLVDLARAFLLTRDRRYVEEATSQLRSWLEDNPVGFTVNWACTMDVAIRAVNWIWCLAILAPELDDDDLGEVIAGLYKHGSFIAANLEANEIAGNHYVSDAVGLIAIGSLFRQSCRGRRWLDLGEHILRTEMPRQVYPDGVDHEMSIPYHRLVTELFLTGLLLLRRAGREPPSECWKLLERMGVFTASYTRPDGTAPVWGDGDDGRLQRFGLDSPNDHRHLLSTMAVLFGDRSLASTAGLLHEDTLWLLGSEAYDDFGELAALSSLAMSRSVRPAATWFPDGGVAILCSDNGHLFLDAGPVGLRGRGGHGHNDALSFELWLDGSPLVIDPGSYVYTADAAARNRYRSTASHNGPMLADLEIAELGDERNLWSIADEARAALDCVGTGGGTAFASGHHHGYARFPGYGSVKRQVELKGRSCYVRDEVRASGEWSVRLTLHPSVHTIERRGADVILHRPGRSYRVSTSPASPITPVKAMCSPSYGTQLETGALVVEFHEGEQEISIHPEPDALP
jgi:hypothetical protein